MDQEKLAEIAERIMIVMKKLKIEYLPTQLQLANCDETLRNLIQNSGGYKEWSKRLGIPNKREYDKLPNKEPVKVPIVTDKEIERARQALEAEEKYAEQCKAGDVKIEKLSPEELKKYMQKGKREYIPSMINIENLTPKGGHTTQPTKQIAEIKKGETKVKRLKIEQVHITGKVLNYKKQDDTVSIINNNMSIRIKMDELGNLIEELQELKEMVANG